MGTEGAVKSKNKLRSFRAKRRAYHQLERQKFYVQGMPAKTTSRLVPIPTPRYRKAKALAEKCSEQTREMEGQYEWPV
jgi:hypothetical protein